MESEFSSGAPPKIPSKSNSGRRRHPFRQPSGCATLHSQVDQCVQSRRFTNNPWVEGFRGPDGKKNYNLHANMEVDPTERSWARWEWIFGAFIIVSLIASSRLGHRLPMILQNFAQLVVICAPLLLTMMSWVRLARVRNDGSVSRWRFRVSFLGCVALSFALLIPLVVIFFSMLFPFDWLRLAIWSLASSLVALLAGCFGAGSMRFPLILGGLVMGGLVVIVPVGIL